MYNIVNFEKTFKNIFDSFDENFHADVLERDDLFEIKLDIPGVEKKDIEISLENRVLTIQAKREKESDCKFISKGRWSGENKTAYKLSFPAEEKDISAELKDGVLTVKIPKTRAPTKRIEIA